MIIRFCKSVPKYGRGQNFPEDINAYLGRLVNFYSHTYTVVHVEPPQWQQSGSACLYLAREDSDDGRPVGMWTEAARIAAPGLTILHWNYHTDYRENTAKCTELYQAAMKAEQERKEERDRANEKRRAEMARCEMLFKTLCPSWAKAYLVAELREDESDTMQDYHGYRVTQTVLLAFSRSERNSFPEMRKMAASFPPTAHLAGSEGIEQRENYSGGGGYYLSTCSRYSGWVVYKRSLKYGPPGGGNAIMDFSHWIAEH